MSLDTSASPDFEYIAETIRLLAQQYLSEEISFNDLGTKEIQSVVGGIWPDMSLPLAERRKSYPYGTTRTGFYLRRAENADRLEVQISVPQKSELFPNEIQLYINGKLAHRLGLDSVDQFGAQSLSADLSNLGPETDVL